MPHGILGGFITEFAVHFQNYIRLDVSEMCRSKRLEGEYWW